MIITSFVLLLVGKSIGMATTSTSKILLTLIFISVCCILVFQLHLLSTYTFQIRKRETTDISSYSKLQRRLLLSEENNVVIGIVVCTTNRDNSSLYEGAVLIKSAIISARLYDVKKLTFYIVLEHKIAEEFFNNKLTELGYPFIDVQVSIIYRSALDIVPKKYWNGMIYDGRFRCGYVRFFFPIALAEVDSILYLDTDTIITGNIENLWDYLSNMKECQMIGMVPLNAINNPNFPPPNASSPNDTPYTASRRLMSGLMLMNLTKLREYHALEKILRLYDDYSKKFRLNDQKLINMFLYYAEGLLQTLPCHFNFRNNHCVFGLYCDEAMTDIYGVHIIHGAGSQFHKGENFYQLYEMYKNFSIPSNEKEFRNNVVIPVRNAYKLGSAHSVKVVFRNNRTDSQCFGVLDNLLYKNFE